MILENKKILIVSPEPWTHIFVSKHHYAVHLAQRGNKVFFLNPPGQLFQSEKSGYDNLTILNYPGFFRGMRFLPKIARKLLIQLKWQQLQKLAKLKFDVVWSFDNSVFYDFDALPSSVLKISHIVDLNQNFQTKHAASTADICFGVIPAIVERLAKFNTGTHFIGHGVTINEVFDIGLVLPGLNSAKALYFGNLDMPHIDWHLLLLAGQKLDKVDFLMLGNCRHDSELKLEFKSLPNVYFMQAVPATSLHSVMSMVDILLVAYSPDYFLEYANPHKMYEYLSSGKPILSTNNTHFEAYSELVEMSNSREDWVEKLEFITNNLDYYSGDKLTHMRKSIAKENAYEVQLDRIDRLLGDIQK
jgi:glycosyltransferase involved in cell wall biosynthesis